MRPLGLFERSPGLSPHDDPGGGTCVNEFDRFYPLYWSRSLFLGGWEPEVPAEFWPENRDLIIPRSGAETAFWNGPRL